MSENQERTLTTDSKLDERDTALIDAAWNTHSTAICPRGRNHCNHADASYCCGGGINKQGKPENCDCLTCHPQEALRMNEIPRRVCIDRLIPEEARIRDALIAVEALGAHPQLTTVVTLLADAQTLLANWHDGGRPGAAK